MFLLTNLKDLLNPPYKKKRETELRNFFSHWISNGYSMIYVNVGGIRDRLRQNLALQLCRNQNKEISILTETYINLDQIHHITKIWLGAIFFSPKHSNTKELVILLYQGLEGVPEVDTDPKRTFVIFKVPLSNKS